MRIKFKMDTERKNQLLTLLAEAQENVANNSEIPTDFARVLFPPERKEYELTYYGKESRQSIISKTFAAPIQIDREFGTDQTSGSWLNKIIFGDNLQVLKTLTEWKKNGDLKNADGTDGARVVYIDPPFASKQDFSNKDERAYADKLKGANFLEWLRKRLILLREVLADDGTILVHLDWHKSHYVKVLLDEIFGETNFRNEIIWHYQTYQGHVFKYFPRKHDTLLVYSKNTQSVFKSQKDGNPENTIDAKRWSEFYNDQWQILGEKYPKTDSRFNGYISRFQKEHGHDPKAKDVIFENFGQTVDDVWDIKAVDPKDKKEKVGYPTQKPEKLLQRVINSYSVKGDLVLDVFGGSGTTAAVAEKMKRRWITGDVGKLSIYTIQKRILSIPDYQAFGVYNAGHYDESRLRNFSSNEWKKFAMSLYDIEPLTETINGFCFDGVKDGEFVKVYSPKELLEIGGPSAKITEDTLEDIYRRVKNSIGSEVFIIAPQGKFGFAVDEYNHNGDWDTIFTILRIPYTLMTRFTESFSAIRQADDSESVNDAIDAVGYDFIRPPKVEFQIEGKKLMIKSFEAESRTKGEYANHDFEAFSMVLIDSNYDGKTFKFTNVYFKTDFVNRSLDISNLQHGKRAMFIFIDKFGNEFKKEVKLK